MRVHTRKEHANRRSRLHLDAIHFAIFSPNYCRAARVVAFISRVISEYRLNACEFSECPDMLATSRLSPVAEYAICNC